MVAPIGSTLAVMAGETPSRRSAQARLMAVRAFGNGLVGNVHGTVTEFTERIGPVNASASGAGVSEDFGLAKSYAHMRTLRLADGPDEVHNRTIARLEYAKHGGRGG